MSGPRAGRSGGSAPSRSAADPASWFFPVPRVACQNCGVVRQVKVAFADVRRSYTKTFERYALELSRHMTILDVAHQLDVSWDVIKDIQKRDLSRRYSTPKLKHSHHIAIDEIAVAKGHRYMTVVMDLDRGAVVFVGDGKEGDALKPFWKRLRSTKARIEAVAMDTSAAYREAVSVSGRSKPATDGRIWGMKTSHIEEAQIRLIGSKGSSLHQEPDHVEFAQSGHDRPYPVPAPPGLVPAPNCARTGH